MNEKRLDKIEEARKKESRTRLMKEKLCAEISKYDGPLVDGRTNLGKITRDEN